MKHQGVNYFLILLSICILITTIFMPSFGSIDTSDDKSEDILTYDYSFSFPELVEIDSNKHLYSIQMNNLPNSNEFKMPRVPVKPLSLLIPYGMNVQQVAVETSEKITIANNITLEYTGAVIPLSERSALSDTSTYLPEKSNTVRQNKEPENNFYSIVGTYILRGYRILNINLYPVQYDQETGSIDFYEEMRLHVYLESADPVASFRNNIIDTNVVNNYIENPQILATYSNSKLNMMQTDEQYEYVIITDNNMKNAKGEYTFQDLISFKQEKGVSATIVTIEDICNNPSFSADGVWGDNNPDNPFYLSPVNNPNIFDDTQARIRNFIRYAYMNWGTQFVLLGGDSDTDNPIDLILPHRGLFADEDGLPLDNNTVAYETDDIPSDVYYACLDGNFNYDEDHHFGDAPRFNTVDNTIDEADLYAEVFVGRACVDSEEEVSNFVKKTISYDEIFYDEYFSKILFLGEFLGSQFYYSWGGEYKDLIEPIIPSEYNLIKVYQGEDTWDTDYYWSLLNEDPPLIINHDGHGSPTSAMGLSCRTIEQLQNEKYYFIYSHTCLAGSFDNCWPPNTYYDTDCVAEYFTVETEHGAIGVVMNSRYGLGSETSPMSPSGAYDESFFKAVFEEDIRQTGAANHYSKEKNIWQINENGYRWAFYETNLFGDPEIALKEPTPSIEVSVDITKPDTVGSLYIDDNSPIFLSFLNKPFILGGITIQADVEIIPDDMIDSVEFFINEKLVYTTSEQPFEYYWDEQNTGPYEIKVISKAFYGFSDEATISVFNVW